MHTWNKFHWVSWTYSQARVNRIKSLELHLKTRKIHSAFLNNNLFFLSFQLVSLLLIGIATWGIGFGLISSFRVVGVAIAVGIFLFLIALVGLIGAVKHHQVLLFFVSFCSGSLLPPHPYVRTTSNSLISSPSPFPAAICISFLASLKRGNLVPVSSSKVQGTH